MIFFIMKRTAAFEQLASLHAALTHFELSPDFGDAEAVDAIRRHLQNRIREAEGALRRPPWMQLAIKAEAA
jgi:predicted trehalose synthase